MFYSYKKKKEKIAEISTWISDDHHLSNLFDYLI